VCASPGDGDGDGDGDLGTIQCGNSSCPAGGNNACCIDARFTENPPYEECVDAPFDADGCNTQEDSTGDETRAECMDSSNCPGSQICCGTLYFIGGNGPQTYEVMECKDACEVDDVQMCDPSVLGECQAGVCDQSGILPTGWHYCNT
jgi:hypothetical protein